MEFIIKVPERSVHDILDEFGYKLRVRHASEFDATRKVGKQEYPRLYLHVAVMNGGEVGYRFTLGLELKKLTGEGLQAHGRDYNHVMVKEEAKRIQRTLT